MKLLRRALLRYNRKHWVQALITMLVTMLIVAMFTFLFIFVSSFRATLSNFAIREIGEYHYLYSAETESKSADLLAYMANVFSNDSFFEKVSLEDVNGTTSLRLYLASPNLVSSKRMDLKYNDAISQYRKQVENLGNRIDICISQNHNYDLLVAYGDLSKSNGMYSYLLIFFLAMGIITITSIFSLSAVFSVSSLQRERDAALFISIGADERQIVKAAVTDSIMYAIISLPLGMAMGYLAFCLSSHSIDDLLSSLADFAPIEIVISIPCIVITSIVVIALVAISSVKPALAAARTSSVVLLRQTQSILYREKGKNKSQRFSKLMRSNVSLWLAAKNYYRYKKRYKSLTIVMMTTIVLCFFMVGLSDTAKGAICDEMQQHGNELQVDLFSDELDAVNSLINRLASQTDGQLQVLRQARFELKPPYSQTLMPEYYGNSKSKQIPDTMLLCLSNDEFIALCSEHDVEVIEGKPMGLVIKPMREKGEPENQDPFDHVNESVVIYSDYNNEDITDGLMDINIAGIIEYPINHVNTANTNRLFIALPEDLFLYLEPFRPFASKDKGIYRATIYDTDIDLASEEHKLKDILNGQDTVFYEITNSEQLREGKKASVGGFQFLMMLLVLQLTIICFCSNIVVMWTDIKLRLKEASVLVSEGMSIGEVKNVYRYEHLIVLFKILIPSFFVGIMICITFHFLYSIEHFTIWHFPWKGVGLSFVLLGLSFITAEIIMPCLLGKKELIEVLRVDE